MQIPTDIDMLMMAPCGNNCFACGAHLSSGKNSAGASHRINNHHNIIRIG